MAGHQPDILSEKGMSPIQEGSAFMTHLLPKAPHPNTITLGVGLQRMNFRGAQPCSPSYKHWWQNKWGCCTGLTLASAGGLQRCPLPGRPGLIPGVSLSWEGARSEPVLFSWEIPRKPVTKPVPRRGVSGAAQCPPRCDAEITAWGTSSGADLWGCSLRAQGPPPALGFSLS